MDKLKADQFLKITQQLNISFRSEASKLERKRLVGLVNTAAQLGPATVFYTLKFGAPMCLLSLCRGLNGLKSVVV